MKKHLSVLLFISCNFYLLIYNHSQLFAVDFNFVREGNHYWFGQGDETTKRPIFVFSNDSVIQKEDETRYVSYPYLRYNINWTSDCQLKLGDSWIGKHVTQTSDGKILFFNANGDTISLLLEVFIKSPLTAFTYSNGDVLKVHGVERKDTVLFGIKDVVDVFDVWRENSDGLIQNDPVNEMQIMVSKNLGVIAMPAFYLLDVQQFDAIFGSEKFEIYHLVGIETDSMS